MTSGLSEQLGRRSNLAQVSVQQFFSAINWENQPPVVQQLRQAVVDFTGVSPLLDPTLPVKQFFAAINWDGGAIAAEFPSGGPQDGAGGATEPADGLTLDDFSSLF